MFIYIYIYIYIYVHTSVAEPRKISLKATKLCFEIYTKVEGSFVSKSLLNF